MTEIIIPDTAAELLRIWQIGEISADLPEPQESPWRGGVLQMMQATRKGLVVVMESPVPGRWPSGCRDNPLRHKCVFDIRKCCRADLYRAIGPNPWHKGVYIESDQGPKEYCAGDRVLVDLTLTVNDFT